MKIPIDYTYKTHGRPLGWGSGPLADWKVMFSIFAILLVVFGIFSYRMFINTKSNLELGAGEESGAPIDTKTLRSASAFYQKQRLELEETLSVPEVIQDPSI